MKKLFLTLLSLVSIGSFAQTAVGVRGSVTAANLTSFQLLESVTPEFKWMPSAGAAIFLELPLNDKISLQPELSFLQKGFAIREGVNVGGEFLGIDIPVNGRLNFKANYVEVPVLAKFHLGDKEAAHSYLAIGPSVAYMADAKMRLRVLEIFPVNINVNDNFLKPFELSGVVAAGFEVPLAGKVSAFTEARYIHGFSRTLDTPLVQLPVRSRTFSGGAGLKIKL